jgi:tetratricopeptide (TPR) repeat protein
MNEPHPDGLPRAIALDIKWLSGRGDDHAERGMKEAALADFAAALNLLPPPAHQWDAFTWLHAAIGDVHFRAGEWAACASAFRQSLTGPHGADNPYIHLRLGQCAYETGQMDAAVTALRLAYDGAGEEIFEEDPLYLEFLRANAPDLP